MVAHAQREDALVDAQARRVEDEVLSINQFFLIRGLAPKLEIQKKNHIGLLVDGLDRKLLVVERDVADLGPREAHLRTRQGLLWAEERGERAWQTRRVPRATVANLGGESVRLLVDVESERVDAEVQLRALLVADVEVL